MILPKTTKQFCKHCKTHTDQKVSLSKNRTRNSTHPLSLGSKIRMNRRSEACGSGNLGKVSRGAKNKWKRHNKKQSKKPDIRYTCSACKKGSTTHKLKRGKKFEFK